MRLIVHSPSTKYIAETFKGTLFEVQQPPTYETLYFMDRYDDILAVGGGSVIDTAKIFAMDRPIVAIPTTASGAACTSYATVWYKNAKKSIPTALPILKRFKLKIELPKQVLEDTYADCLGHIVESYWSLNGNSKSLGFLSDALQSIKLFNCSKDINFLIEAGNWAGMAINITRTNIIHALSYGLTYRYGLPHGRAVSVFLKKIVKAMKPNLDLPDLPEYKFEYDLDWVVEEAFKYNNIDKYLTKRELLCYLSE